MIAEPATALPHANLWLYFTLVVGIGALPRVDMGIVLASRLAGGRHAGFGATAPFAARARDSLASRPAAGTLLARAVGALLVAAGCLAGWAACRWH